MRFTAPINLPIERSKLNAPVERAIMYDESFYGPGPQHFNPERFMSPDGTLNSEIPHPTMAFGFGRRQCPGIELAETSLWLTISSILFCFNITKYVDENGVVDEPSGRYTSGMLW